MASPIRTVALCSPTGKMGPYLLQALQAEGFAVTVVLRASSKASFPPDQKIVRVSDGYLEDELTSAFRGQDAVVLSLSFEMLSESAKFAKASIAAGCRWLIPSTYGANLNDPKYALFPASIPHRQAVDELLELQKGQDSWAWTSIVCGPWVDLAIPAGAWNLNASAKTAELVEGGQSIFTVSTRTQVALAAARVLKKQLASTRNACIYVSSFETSMSKWLDAYKQIVGADGWKVTSVDGAALLKKSQDQLASGEFFPGYMGTALVVCTGKGYLNHFSSFTTLANKELDLPQEDLMEVAKVGLATPNPYA